MQEHKPQAQVLRNWVLFIVFIAVILKVNERDAA
jgi:hypothetical protein